MDRRMLTCVPNPLSLEVCVSQHNNQRMGPAGEKTSRSLQFVIKAQHFKGCLHVEHVLVLKCTGNEVPWTQGRDKWWHEKTAQTAQDPYWPVPATRRERAPLASSLVVVAL